MKALPSIGLNERFFVFVLCFRQLGGSGVCFFRFPRAGFLIGAGWVGWLGGWLAGWLAGLPHSQHGVSGALFFSPALLFF